MVHAEVSAVVLAEVASAEALVVAVHTEVASAADAEAALTEVDTVADVIDYCKKSYIYTL